MSKYEYFKDWRDLVREIERVEKVIKVEGHFDELRVKAVDLRGDVAIVNDYWIEYKWRRKRWKVKEINSILLNREEIEKLFEMVKKGKK
ncbi:MAG: hypothetical protein NZ893_01580 [Candidatus Aenigmarchaeota archaeon]|nr:hypothetical protein [Candidatus Aenigmarchaeota archaeon]